MQVSETQRALLLPQEVIQLPRDEQIILVESFSPIKCKKIFYFKDPFFKKRLLPQVVLPIQEPYDPRKKKKVAAAPPPPPPPKDENSGPPAEA
jgi:type IV secretion system protein VirD4